MSYSHTWAVVAGVLVWASSPLALVASSQAQPSDSLTVTFLANEGVMLSSGGATVLIDALFGEGLSGYGVVSPATRRLLESATAPFDRVSAVLATHIHDDHFNANAVLAHLRANPRATFVSTAQAVQRVRAAAGGGAGAIGGRLVVGDVRRGERRTVISSEGVTIYTLGLPHGGEGPTTNVGFIVDVGGYHVLHVGDSSEGMEAFRTMRLGDLGIDVALLPPHYLRERALQEVVRREMRPAYLAVVHPPDGFIARLRDRWSSVLHDIRAAFPNARVFSRELETMVVKGPPVASRPRSTDSVEVNDERAGVRLTNRSGQTINFTLFERSLAERIDWVPCVAGPNECTGVAAGATRVVPWDSISGFGRQSRDALAYVWRLVRDSTGYRAADMKVRAVSKEALYRE